MPVMPCDTGAHPLDEADDAAAGVESMPRSASMNRLLDAATIDSDAMTS